MTVRADVKAVLDAWVAGDMAELAVWEWGQQTRAQLAQTPAADELVRDIVDTLAALPFDMITSEDAVVMLDALANPVEETDLSVNLLWNHLDGISADERRYQHREHPFYGQFADGLD